MAEIKNWAIYDVDGKVTNVISYDGNPGYNPGVGLKMVQSDTAGVGHTYDEATGTFTMPDHQKFDDAPDAGVAQEVISDVKQIDVGSDLATVASTLNDLITKLQSQGTLAPAQNSLDASEEKL